MDTRRPGGGILLALGLAVVLCVAYNSLVTHVHRPWFFPAPNMFQDNRICAQDLILAHESGGVLVVGSSLTWSLGEYLPAR